MQNNINDAVTILNQGGIIVFPTDTAFGIGCRVDNHTAIERLFALRKRPLNQPTPVLVANKKMAKEYIATLAEEVEHKLIDRYWPGALTIIVPAKESVDSLVQRDGGIGLRMPNHNVIQELIQKVGVGLLGPSANFHGNKTPFSFDELDPELLKQVDYVLEGVCSVKSESTVISCLTKPWKVVRQGAVKVEL